MTESPYVPAADLQRLASVIGDATEGEALTHPVATMGEHGLCATVFVYRQPARPGVERLRPPNFRVIFAVATGDVIDADICTPADFGVPHRANQLIEGFGLPGTPPREFWPAQRRLLALSDALWPIFAPPADAAPADQQTTRALAAEYLRLFDRAVYHPLHPYYRAVAPDWFRWLARTTT